MQKIIIGTTNQGKLRSVIELLKNKDIALKVEVLPEDLEEPEENGKNYAENALIKARFYSKKLGLPVISDDSGVEIKQLNNFPGMHAKRYAMELGGYQEAFKDLKNKLKNYPKPHKARFVTCLAYVDYKNEIEISETGEMCGSIKLPPKGKDGFGYTPIFYINNYTKAVAEMQVDEYKNDCQRAKALHKLLDRLLSLSIIK
jgi:XTP/dITP diphosphohydrolase